MSTIYIIIIVLLLIVLFGKFKMKKEFNGKFLAKVDLRPRHGKFGNLKVCVKCEHTLSDNDVYYSSGRCQYCGHKGYLAVTITDYENVAIRYDRTISDWIYAKDWGEEQENYLQKENEQSK